MLALIIVTACWGPDPRHPPKRTEAIGEDAAWALVRQMMTDPKSCFRQRPAYCITDVAYTDAFVQHELDRAFDGLMPLEQRQVTQLGLSARRTLLADLLEDSRHRVSQRITENYNNPTPKTAGTVTRFWMGLPPGDLIRTPSGLHLATDLTDRGEWATTEIARTFDRFASSPSDTLRLQVEVPIEGTNGYRLMEIAWTRSEARIDVWDKADATQGWTVPVGAEGLAPYLTGAKSLHTSSLRRCPTAAYGAPPTCPPL